MRLLGISNRSIVKRREQRAIADRVDHSDRFFQTLTRETSPVFWQSVGIECWLEILSPFQAYMIVRADRSKMEVDPRLVPGAVFKTVGLHGNHVAGGFDSHALPPFSILSRLFLQFR